MNDPFAALADPHRRLILEQLSGGELSVQELADSMPITRPAVSRHLKLLTASGLVAARPEGVKRMYRLDHVGVEEARRYMEAVWGDAVVRFRMASDNLESS